jgi:uncharacterized protein (TIGR02757 family)
MNRQTLQHFLDKRVQQYNIPAFIKDDPVAVPHLFTKKQDIEIAGFFAAIFAWGHRTIIINKSKELMQLMDMAPHQFITQHQEADLQKLLRFKHRTFNADDLLYFIDFFRRHYAANSSLETAFSKYMTAKDATIENGLIGFRRYFFEGDHIKRTQKHISSPLQKSSCKRINMFLRWMVRKDNNGVDFGIWNNLRPAQLVCPLDVHVIRVATRLGLLQRDKVDWLAALELTAYLRLLDASDPVKYDFALFGLGVTEKL